MGVAAKTARFYWCALVSVRGSNEWFRFGAGLKMERDCVEDQPRRGEKISGSRNNF